jgi:hypothetical protein
MTEHRDLPDDLSLRAHRRIIGALGLVLPPVLYVLAGLRLTDGLPPWTVLRSVSAYYYTGATGVFVGVLFALSLFLFTYRGYKGVLVDRIVGIVAGAAAAAVALFPTSAPDGLCEPTWWTETTGRIHHAAATVLFLCFIVFSVWLFRKSSVPRRRDRPREKRRRDDVCLACGIIMAVGVVWAFIAWNRQGSIFLPEAVAIIAFAVSWLVKGEVQDSAGHLVKSVIERFQ